MRILNENQLEQLEIVISRQNVEGCKRALKDGVKIWIFQTWQEAFKDLEITEEEKNFCLERFTLGEEWVGIFRRPAPTPIPGVTIGVLQGH